MGEETEWAELKGRREAACGGKGDRAAGPIGQKPGGGEKEGIFLFFSYKSILNWILNSFLSFEINHSIQKLQCSSMSAQQCFYLIFYFNLIKIITSLYLNAHKMHN
jgi:hypothetical protein